VTLAAGTASINVRDVPHGAFKVIGDKTLKLLTVRFCGNGVLGWRASRRYLILAKHSFRRSSSKRT
jgi:hypothetical protein